MQAAFDAFQVSMQRTRSLHELHASLSKQFTSVVDLSDLLRSEIVLAVSAFDFFIHELTRLGMLECHLGKRVKTSAFNRFQLPMHVATSMSESSLDVEIRVRHGYLSFQQPDKVADAIRLFSDVELWNKVGDECRASGKELKDALSLIVDRRNKIAHEADLDPSYPAQHWPIDRGLVEYIFDFIDKIVCAIFKIVN